MHADPRLADEAEDLGQRDRFGGDRNRRQAEARRDLAVVRDAAEREMVILRAQPDAVAERSGVLQCAQQHQRIVQRHVRLRERDAAGFGELAHLGQRRAGETDGERADRIDVRLADLPRAVLQHLDEAGLVERRIGVGRARKAGDAAGRRRGELRFERRLVLETRLAQPRGEIDESRTHDATGGIDHPVGPPVARRFADARDHFRIDEERRCAIERLRRIDQPAIADFDLHGALNSPRRSRALPCARRCRT